MVIPMANLRTAHFFPFKYGEMAIVASSRLSGGTVAIDHIKRSFLLTDGCAQIRVLTDTFG